MAGHTTACSTRTGSAALGALRPCIKLQKKQLPDSLACSLQECVDPPHQMLTKQVKDRTRPPRSWPHGVCTLILCMTAFAMAPCHLLKSGRCSQTVVLHNNSDLAQYASGGCPTTNSRLPCCLIVASFRMAAGATLSKCARCYEATLIVMR